MPPVIVDISILRVRDVTRIPIDMDKLQRFKLHEPDQPAQKNPIVMGEVVPTSHRKIDYNMMSTSFHSFPIDVCSS